jgi:bloom syndrome protein
LTATATIKVKEDIVKRLGIADKVHYFQSSFNRPNLVYEIRNKAEIKNLDEDIVELVSRRFKNKSGIIYCISRKDCERLAEVLSKKYNVKCDFYHADISLEKRNDI